MRTCKLSSFRLLLAIRLRRSISYGVSSSLAIMLLKCLNTNVQISRQMLVCLVISLKNIEQGSMHSIKTISETILKPGPHLLRVCAAHRYFTYATKHSILLCLLESTLLSQVASSKSPTQQVQAGPQRGSHPTLNA